MTSHSIYIAFFSWIAGIILGWYLCNHSEQKQADRRRQKLINSITGIKDD